MRVVTNRTYLLLFIIIFILFGCSSSSSHSEHIATSKIAVDKKLSALDGWIESDTINLDQLKPDKSIFIFYWTTWCKGCKQAEKWYLEDTVIYSRLNKNFHLVKANGDSTVIVMKGKEYRPTMENYSRRHELALKYGKTWFGYPNILIFNKKLEFVTPYEPQLFMGKPADNFLADLDSLIILTKRSIL